jgi:hypothetical protein
MPRFDEAPDADDAALAHPLSEALRRASIPTSSGTASATSRNAESYPPSVTMSTISCSVAHSLQECAVPSSEVRMDRTAMLCPHPNT